jgi:hypothetical protein
MDALEDVAGRPCFLKPPFDLGNVAGAADDFQTDLIVLDYIQRFGCPGSHGDRRGSVEATMNYLRQFADQGVAVLVVAAVSRTKDDKGRSSYSGKGLKGTIRGYSGVTLLVIDEAARVLDDLYRAVRPMLAVSGGRLMALSTPFGQRGWFYEEWTGPGDWQRVKVTADQCPRITPEFLGEERRSMGERWFRQEYECCFESTTDAVFAHEHIHGAVSAEVQLIILG